MGAKCTSLFIYPPSSPQLMLTRKLKLSTGISKRPESITCKLARSLFDRLLMAKASNMPGLSWIPSRTYLRVFFFSCWILCSTAFLVDEKSCSHMTLDDASGRPREYNKLDTVKGVLRETELMAGSAADSIRDVKKGHTEPFDRLRTEEIVTALRGIHRDDMTIKQQPWKDFASE